MIKSEIKLELDIQNMHLGCAREFEKAIVPPQVPILDELLLIYFSIKE